MATNTELIQETVVVNGKKPICINFGSSVSPVTNSALSGVLADVVRKDHDEIHLFLSTPGGTVQDGIAIYNFIRALPVPLITYNIGQVNSIGNVIYQAGQKRVASKTSSFMFHGVGFDIENTRMELKELRERTQSIENDQALITDIMARHTPLSPEDVNALFLQMEFFGANEAFKRGITDEVTDIRLPKGMPILSLVFQR